MSLSLEFMHQVAASIMATSNERTISLRVTSIGGGGISASFRLSIGERDYFLKTNKSDRLPMFEAEMAALKEITTIGAVRAPIPICTGVAEGHSFLALEWLVFHPLDQAAAMRLGRAMAALHRHTAPQFGWHRQNTIGATPQINTYTSDWPAFWKEYRLGFQLRLAERNGYLGRIQDLGTQLLTRCDELFSEYTPQPSFLHGDLWHGNTACNPSGEPLIFDPASYYGDRETDLAMTSLFGGFPDAFMAAYNSVWPVHQGYAQRRDFYNIYHLLNHLNLFGKGYLAQTETTMQRVLATLG
jgi:protein-ribulosamine 3-kinase